MAAIDAAGVLAGWEINRVSNKLNLFVYALRCCACLPAIECLAVPESWARDEVSRNGRRAESETWGIESVFNVHPYARRDDEDDGESPKLR